MGYEENNVAHRKNNSSSITADVIKSVYEADLCIANLTENNANVMYELALRHAAKKHVIIITKDISSLPFDINDQRAIQYTNDIQGALELKIELKSKIEYIEAHEDEISNPIYDNLQKVVIKDSSIPEISVDIQQSIQQLLNDMNFMKSKIKKLDNNSINKDYTFKIDNQTFIDSMNYEINSLRGKFYTLKSNGNRDDISKLLHQSVEYLSFLNSSLYKTNNENEKGRIKNYIFLLEDLITQMTKYLNDI